VRLKSGRADLPASKRTTSLSCSDKIARWLAIGIQSSLLSHVFAEPLRVDTVIVSADPSAEFGSQLSALQRAILDRSPHFPSETKIVLSNVAYAKSKSKVEAICCSIGSLSSSSSSSVADDEMSVLGKRKDRLAEIKSIKIRPFGTSANWIRGVPAAESTCERTQAQGGYLIGITKKDLLVLNTAAVSKKSSTENPFPQIKKIVSRLSQLSFASICLESIDPPLAISSVTTHDMEGLMAQYRMWKNAATAVKRDRQIFLESDRFKNYTSSPYVSSS
jgi:hypothetical protein